MRIVAEDNRIVHDMDSAQLMRRPPSRFLKMPKKEDLLHRRRADGGVYPAEDCSLAYGRLCSC